MFGWSYDYLLWGISWLNVQTMLADAARVTDVPNGDDGGEDVNREIHTKEEIDNYITSLM